MSPVGQVPTACGLRTAHLPGPELLAIRPACDKLPDFPARCPRGLSSAKKVKGLAPCRDGRCQWTGFDKAQPSGNRRMTGTRRGRVPAARPARGSHPSWKWALELRDGQHWRRAQAHGWRPWGDGAGGRGEGHVPSGPSLCLPVGIFKSGVQNPRGMLPCPPAPPQHR